MPTYQGNDPNDPSQGFWLQDDGTMSMGPAPIAPGAPNMSVQPPPVANMSQGAPAAPPSTSLDQHFAAIDAINPAPPKPTMQTVGSSTTTQSGPGAKVIDPILANKTDAANQYASTVEQVGGARSDRQRSAIEGEQEGVTNLKIDAQLEQQQQQDKLDAANKERLALANQEDPKIDPNRFVASMSTGKTIGTVILAALNGAFKAVQGQPGNDVVAILQSKIDEDIKAQQSQIENGKVRRNNLIAYYQGEGLDARQAMTAAKAQALGLAAKQIELQAQLVGTPEAKEQGQLLAAQIRDQQTQANDDLRLSLAPKSSTTTQRQLGLPPGTAQTDPEKVLKLAAEMRKNNYSQQQIDAFYKQNGVRPPEGEAGAPKFNRDQARLKAGIEESRAKLQQIGQLRGFYYDQKTGQFVAGGKNGTSMIMPAAFDSQNANIRAIAESVAPVVGLVQGVGLKGHEPEIQRIQEGLTAHSDTVALANLNAHMRSINNIEKGVNEFPSGAQQESVDEASPQ